LYGHFDPLNVYLSTMWSWIWFH